MARIKSLALLTLLGLTLLTSTAYSESLDVDDEFLDDEEDEYEDVELDDNRAVLIAHKVVKEETIIQGSNMTIQIMLHNVGKGAATNIKIKDSPLNKKLFSIVNGSPTASISKILPGSSAEHAYVVLPKVGNMKFLGEPAHVQFSPLIEGPANQALLSTSPNVFVLTKLQSLQVHLLKLGRVITFGVLKTSSEWVNSFIVIAVSAGAFGLNALARWYIVSKGERKRAKARAELGADS